MKLMVVGHPFLFAYNQRKYLAMKRADPELRLRLVVPRRGRERFEFSECQVHPELQPEEVVPLPVWPEGSHMTHIHNPVSLAGLLRDFQPDVIHLDPGEPQALLTVETITLRRLFARRAAVTLFSFDNLLRARRFPLGLMKSRLRSYSLPHVSAMICGNRRAAELVREEGRFTGPTEVLPQFGLDAAEHQPGREEDLRRELGLDDAPVIGHIGRFVPEKGLRQIFEALVTLQDHPWKLLLVGSGPKEDEIRATWMPRLPGRIVLHSAVPYDQVARYLRCLDIFVLASCSTSWWAEQFGVALAQAMMLGIACVGSSSGAIPEVLGPGGLRFAEGDGRALAQALEALLRSPESRERFGRDGRRFALQNYTASAVAEKYLAVFDRAREFGVRQAPQAQEDGQAAKIQDVVQEQR